MRAIPVRQRKGGRRTPMRLKGKGRRQRATQGPKWREAFFIKRKYRFTDTAEENSGLLGTGPKDSQERSRSAHADIELSAK